MVAWPDHSPFSSSAAAEPILCPECRGEYSHLAGVIVHRGHTCETIRGNKAPVPSVTRPDGRGSSVVLEMACESGHFWHVYFHFSKGRTFWRTEPVSEFDPSGNEWPEEFWRD